MHKRQAGHFIDLAQKASGGFGLGGTGLSQDASRVRPRQLPLVAGFLLGLASSLHCLGIAIADYEVEIGPGFVNARDGSRVPGKRNVLAAPGNGCERQSTIMRRKLRKPYSIGVNRKTSDYG